MFDLNAMQNADERLQEILEEVSVIQVRSHSMADKTVDALRQSDARILESTKLMNSRPPVCPMAHRR